MLLRIDDDVIYMYAPYDIHNKFILYMHFAHIYNSKGPHLMLSGHDPTHTIHTKTP